jgi:hypothetical protein
MQDSNIPGKLPIPWGNSAGAGYIRPIPTASQISVTPGAASLNDGFPPLNSIPVSAGGVPPFMQDFNGILNLVTAWLRWFQAGGPITYDANFASSIGGYPAGTIVQSTTVPNRLWFCLIDGNTSNPDTGGAGWTVSNVGRLINIRPFLAAGTYSYAPTTGTTFIIVTVVGAGGAGGAAGVTTGSGNYAVGSGGAAGSACKSLLRSGFAGVTVVVGAGGTPFLGNGNPGGTSSFGSILSAPGGGGGLTAALPSGQVGFAGQGLPGAVGVGGNIFNARGQPGLNGLLQGSGAMSGQGGASILGGGSENNDVGNGGFGPSPGAGGSGAGAISTSGGPFLGGPGADGAVIIEEWA